MTVPHDATPGAGRRLLPTATGAHIRAAVYRLLRPHRTLAATGLAVLVVGTTIGLLTAPLLGHVVDLVAAGHPAAALTPPVVALALVAVGQGVCTALGVSLVARLGEAMLARLRERFVDRALHLPLERLEEAGAGDLTARVTRDVTAITEAVRHALPVLARSGLTVALTLAGLAVLDWRFLLAALLAAPIQLHTVRWYSGHARKIYAAHRIADGAQQQQLLDSIGGAATVRAFRLGDRHVGQVAQRSRAVVELAMRGIRLLTGFYGRLNAAEFVALAGVLVTGFVLVRAGSVTIGTATAAALYVHSLFNPINAALALADNAQAATASLARLVGVADQPAPAPRPATASVDTSVKAVDVEYAYRSGHEVLHGVDLELAPGERVALVGASGAGKTTLAKLIAGVHRPTGGSIRLGGVELTELDPALIRRSIALVTQEVHVFAGPLAEDLRLARPDAGDEELRAALTRVGALGWVDALPDGVDTVVGEGGHRLTAAQAQQIALARLVLADPPVAILDEATADAGSASARELENAAARALDGRSALVVAHRLTQAAAADRVVLLADGRVVESGRHADLVAAGGRYAELWQAWSGSREPA
ncbi:ABC transporter ATP-binding protein [Couchioplanes caeruleus]|uniref:Multidrug ABC transporter permease n=2 Tax=Couchioplanes caeruleus TaxID=56438 RepID=A0A1K0FSU7_9ACTN|nr:ABC transporter ATP-binding protein [Couchioplanes caeruleus]OJF15849.1 multidrug ABC transporter permease [Couchioplanes caeruleus subsp. caeruleus]ROP33800.1 ATP-binding cassette subfamily C protein [Couchioplanes caeruleus]